MTLEDKLDIPDVISVIIPCYGHSVELQACLRALFSQEGDFPYEVTVVDSSSDPRVKEITSHFPRVVLICSKMRLFPGAARNLGVQYAASNWLAFLDADCIPDVYWIKGAFESFRSRGKVTGGPILDVEPFHPIAWVDNRLQFADFQAGRPAGNLLHVPSCNMVMTRSIFEETGGFREDLIIGEDVVFTARVNERLPKGVWFNPKLIVRHQGRSDWRRFIEHQQSFGFHRANLGLFLGRSNAWLARFRIFASLFVFRRLLYISLRTLQFDRVGLARLILLLPLVLAGLIAWTKGLYLGMKERKMEKNL